MVKEVGVRRGETINSECTFETLNRVYVGRHIAHFSVPLGASRCNGALYERDTPMR